ncbi:MAG: CPBP family intramembrane glutamic endopeptidase [Clostridium sp.]|uniref:CPBP family intramembrane glutamic endopeptidase n=1 Tax=Clostridium sp. TaxID=1506 RepID=UPI003F34BF9D
MKNSLYSKKYMKIDIIFVLIYYIYLFILNLLYFAVITNLNYFNGNIGLKFVSAIILNVLQLIPIIIFIKYRNQDLDSIGLTKPISVKFVFKGILYFIPILIIRMIFFNYETNYNGLFNINSIIQLIQVAFIEEIIFRGFIQSRLLSVFKNKTFSIILATLMFAFIHNTKYIIIGFSSISFTIILLGTLKLSIKHIYYTFICNNTNSIMTSTITHWLNNIT